MEGQYKQVFFSELNIQQNNHCFSNSHLQTEYTEMVIGIPKLNVLVTWTVFLQVSTSLGKKTTKPR